MSSAATMPAYVCMGGGVLVTSTSPPPTLRCPYTPFPAAALHQKEEFCTKNRKPKGGGGKVGFVGRKGSPPYGRWEGQSTHSWKGVNKPPNRPKPVVRNHILPQESDMRCKICAKREGAFYGPLRDCAVVVGGLLPSYPVGIALAVYAPT